MDEPLVSAEVLEAINNIVEVVTVTPNMNIFILSQNEINIEIATVIDKE